MFLSATPAYSSSCIAQCPSTAITCLIPHPTNCKFYLECIREYGSTFFFNYNIKECGMHQFWNPAKGDCDHVDEFMCPAGNILSYVMIP